MFCNIELSAPSIQYFPLQNISLMLLTAYMWSATTSISHGNIAHENTTNQTADVLAIKDQL